MRFVTARQMQRIDRRAQEEFGIPEGILMEHAGTEVARVARRYLERDRRRKGTILIAAGGGANGGDGFVAARHLDNWGYPVEVLLVADPARVRGAALTNLKILRKLNVPIRRMGTLASWSEWLRKRHTIRLMIDALLGTGISGWVRQPHQTIIEWLNRQSVPIVAVDLPSGLSADTGFPCGVAVKATATVTCGLPKVGLIQGRGPYFSGRVTLADISLPKALR